jgi:hypothetical protein
MEREQANVWHSLRARPSITFKEEAVEIIGVIIAGIIIGLLGQVRRSWQPRQHPDLADHHLRHWWGLDRLVHLHRLRRRRQPGH